MISKAIARYIRVPPRKARQVIRLIKGKNPNQALAILAHTNKRSAGYIAKVVKSAIANVGAKPGIKQEDLYISRIIVDGGPSLKRFIARAMGRATPILKRTSHISVELDSKAPKLRPAPPRPGVKTALKKAVSKSQRVRGSKGETKAKVIKKAKSKTK